MVHRIYMYLGVCKCALMLALRLSSGSCARVGRVARFFYGAAASASKFFHFNIRLRAVVRDGRTIFGAFALVSGPQRRRHRVRFAWPPGCLLIVILVLHTRFVPVVQMQFFDNKLHFFLECSNQVLRKIKIFSSATKDNVQHTRAPLCMIAKHFVTFG